LSAWRSLVDPDGSGTFTQRLAWDGITRAGAESMLSCAKPAAGSSEVWWPTLERIRTSCRTFAEGPDDDLDWLAALEHAMAEGERERADVAFVHLLWPLVATQWDGMLESLEPEAISALAPAARDDLRWALASRLSQVCSRALMEDFARGRPAGRSLMLRLGVTAAQRETTRTAYASYCRRAMADGLISVLAEFPVLGRLLSVICVQWQVSVAETLRRVARDRARLHTAFGASETSAIEEIRWALSDPHRGGRTVAIMAFGRDADEVRVVYKPKDVRIEEGFHGLISEICGELGISLSALTVVPLIDEDEPGLDATLGHYGYVSFIEHVPCDGPAALAEFYRGAGSLLAVLYLLGATDCHHENLIAHGSSLVLVDAETLFEGKVRSLDPADEVSGGQDPLTESVLRTLVLPNWLSDGVSPVLIDISALGVESATLESGPTPGWRGLNTDDMVWATSLVPAAQSSSLPVPSGVPNPLASHVEDLVAGFSQTYTWAMRADSAQRLLAHIAGFAGVRRRLVMRATRTYYLLQRRATSPRTLRSGIERGCELDRLSRSGLLSEAKPPHWAAFEAELRDLENLDIPYFDYPLGSRAIHGAGAVIEGVLEHDGLTEALARVRGLSSDDAAWQVQLIRAAISARFGVSASEPVDDVGPSASSIAAGSGPAPGDLGAEIGSPRGVLKAIADSSISDRAGGTTWLTLSVRPDSERVGLGLATDGLYDGRAGIAVFLYSYEGPDAAAAHALAGEALAPMLRAWDDADDRTRMRYLRDTGLGMSGVGGILRALEVLSRMDSARSVDANARMRSLVGAITDDLVARDRSLDVLGGAAGAMGPVARLHRTDPTEDTRRLLTTLATHLAAAQDEASGGWRTAMSSRPLTGLSHGGSGIGLALIEAGSALGDEHFLAAGARGFAHEGSLFDPDEKNWPDLRSGENGAMRAWCHGGPGIALARLRALDIAPNHPDSDQWRREVIIGADVARLPENRPLDHLCCGTLGRSAILQIIGIRLGDDDLLAAAANRTDVVLERAAAKGRFLLPLSGDGGQSRLLAPGMMTGLAGVGLHLLAGPAPSLRRVEDMITLLV